MPVLFSSDAISSLAANRTRFEPHRQYNFELAILGITRGPWTNSNEVRLHVETTGFPNPSFDEIELGYGNDFIYIAGKARVEPMPVTFRDFVEPHTAQALYGWYQEHYEPPLGNQAFASAYKKTGKLFKFSPSSSAQTPHPLHGSWELRGLWIQNANFGTLDFNASDIVRIEATFRYDRAVGRDGINT